MPAAVNGDLAAAYSATGASWQDGPGRVYDRLATVLVARCPGGVAGRDALDLGAGTGAASRAALAAGARSVAAVDAALGMVGHDAAGRPPAAVGDATALPFADGCFGAVLAAFSLNHLEDPALGLAEAARVLAPGGALAASAYADDDDHPVKAATDAACRQRGWVPEPWIGRLRDAAMPRLATVDGTLGVAADAGLDDPVVEAVRCELADLAPSDLVAWRLGMAQVAPFVSTLDAMSRAALEADVLDRLGPDPPPLVRSMIVLAWQHRP